MPWKDLTDAEKQFVIEGGEGFDGVRGFFRWLERKKYKVHVRVFLSRYRGYLTCPDCGGSRLRREARDVRVSGRTIDQVSALTVREAQTVFASLDLSENWIPVELHAALTGLCGRVELAGQQDGSRRYVSVGE